MSEYSVEEVRARLVELNAFVNGVCSNDEAGRKCLGFIMQHGSFLAERIKADEVVVPVEPDASRDAEHGAAYGWYTDRNAIRGVVAFGCDEENQGEECCKKWCGDQERCAVTFCVARPPAQAAQSVAIYPVGHFIETSAGEYARVSRKHECDGDVFQLYRSTGNAQSVDVEKSFAGLRIVENANVPDGEVWLYDKAKLIGRLTAALQEKGNG